MFSYKNILSHAERAKNAEPAGHRISGALRFIKFCEFCVQ